MKPLDFALIGAQKAATTSVFHYLKAHPQVALPESKEAPFYSWDHWFEAGWTAFAANHFARAASDRLWGTATPQYMMDPAVPARLRAHAPGIRLIALLRDPIARAYSHYTMMVRRGHETRDFDTAIAACLEPAALATARTTRPPGAARPVTEFAEASETPFYVVWGEYGRILAGFLAEFPRDQLLVQPSADYTEAPRERFAELLAFLGLDPQTVPANVGTVYHKGRQRTVIPPAWRHALRRNPGFRLLWERLPERLRERLGTWYDRVNEGQGRATPPRAEAAPEPISEATRDALAAHFAPDLEGLEARLGHAIPGLLARRTP